VLHNSLYAMINQFQRPCFNQPKVEMTIATCSICGGRLINTLVEITKPDRFERHVGIPATPYKRKWIECNLCGSGSNIYCSRSSVSVSALANAYYEVDLGHTNISDRFIMLSRLPRGQSDNIGRVTRILEWLSNYRSGSVDVLDIGAGTGIFLSRLLSDGGHRISRAVGVEPDTLAARHLESLDQFEVINESFPISKELEPFDLITLNKVLEHIEDPIEFLRSILLYIKDQSGLLYVEVPDVLTSSFRDSTNNILGSLHRHLYSPEGLAIALRKSSWMPLRVERFTEPSGKLSIYAFAHRSADAAHWAMNFAI
jgi:SAM-dependent methyltransferase